MFWFYYLLWLFPGLPLAFCHNVSMIDVGKGRGEGNRHSLRLHLLSLEWARFGTELHLIQCRNCSEAEFKH